MRWRVLVLAIVIVMAILALLYLRSDTPFGGDARTFSLRETSSASRDRPPHRELGFESSSVSGVVPANVDDLRIVVEFTSETSPDLTPDSARTVSAIGQQGSTLSGLRIIFIVRGPAGTALEDSRLGRVAHFLRESGVPPARIVVEARPGKSEPVVVIVRTDERRRQSHATRPP